MQMPRCVENVLRSIFRKTEDVDISSADDSVCGMTVDQAAGASGLLGLKGERSA